ncbi:hypothetical protein [Sulfuricystis multivorans]|uniref:hypothetical protein n=1 Tax=Sulfuricystis multivorans TaxID=2211108 RepID=UPI000F83DB0C|nr:hypothetical protein [Sulfuricystis multivorans]
MPAILLSGDPEHAPIYIPDSGLPPAWSGKSIYELTKTDLDAIANFTMNEAYELGKEDFLEDRHETPNPFHRRFLMGVPRSIFETFYRRGQVLAVGSFSASHDLGLSEEGSHGYQPQAVSL